MVKASEVKLQGMLRGRYMSDISKEMEKIAADYPEQVEQCRALDKELNQGFFEDRLQRVNDKYEELNAQLFSLEKEKGDIEGKIALRHNNKNELWAIEEEIIKCKSQIENLEFMYEAAELSGEVLKEAFEDIQQNFAPRLNGEIGYILKEITDGRHESVRISSDYEVNILEENNIRNVEYFSSGTMDQIYFALRLGLCNVIFEGKSVPLILDDTFIQYDEERLKRVIDFLKGYSKTHQVIIFTCRELPGVKNLQLGLN
jgi:Uncharacterized conserved protein